MINDLLRSFDDDSRSRFVIPRPRRRRTIALVIALIVGICVAAGVVFAMLMRPVDSSSSTYVRVIIPSGSTASEIGRVLKDHHLIRNTAVFELYTQFTGTKDRLRAGGHALKKSQSMAEIVHDLTSDKVDDFRVIILPGLTLEQLADPSIPGSLADQGFTPAEIQEAYQGSYDSPLLAGRPPLASLEGYIHPDTYGILTTDPLASVLTMSFKEMQRVVQDKNIESALKDQGLTLHQGIILASIVQKEVSDVTIQPQVAQVFLKRLKEDMTLGSDVTFLYIAKKEGRTPSVNDPSLYNTRRHKGLPPGPIANFNIAALEAVAHPATGDYLYFVAGDDGKTYFARTEDEHIANIRAHCQKLCSE